ncbi:hypothetical protein COU37_05215 [Candidatus Micrarchaeota archaeon CG10_big_fil_rev_8_21_14_0_10_45_29]|nr:MAG: hypothetical protein COU37_05215 [Candidatus Micrarchaeota archaeon CG10_big_fil_rev_8_21_14_0_10_45_29]
MDRQYVIIDTNFWLAPFEFRVDLLAQLEKLAEYKPMHILVPTPVRDELKMMAGMPAKIKNSRSARAALKVVERLLDEKKATLYEIEGKADGAIISAALQKSAWVATNDNALRQKLKEKRIKTIVLRDKHILTFA